MLRRSYCGSRFHRRPCRRINRRGAGSNQVESEGLSPGARKFDRPRAARQRSRRAPRRWIHQHPRQRGRGAHRQQEMQLAGADGKSQDADLKARDALWSPAGKHFGENAATEPIEAVIVELKGNNAPTAIIPTSRPDVGDHSAVRQTRARGQSRRSCRRPSTRLRARRTTTIRSLSPWRRPTSHCSLDGKPARTSWKAGDAEFIGRGVKHESKNNGQKPADVFILAIK